MDINVIHTDEEHAAAMVRIEALIEADEPDHDQIRLLSLVLQDYEERTLPRLKPPGPIEAILFRMEQQDLKPKDLVPYIGSRGRVHEVLTGQRQVSKAMALRLHEGLGIPLLSLLQEPQSA